MPQSARSTRHICLFGTSANPPTGNGGHKGIISHLASMMASSATHNNDTGSSIKGKTSGSNGDNGKMNGAEEEEEKERFLFDEVRVLPVYSHMFATKRSNLIGFDDRLAMCRLAFKDMPRVTVSDQERRCFEWVASKKGITTEEEKATLRVGTADLLDMLLEKETTHVHDSSSSPTVNNTNNTTLKFSFALGADTFMDLTSWKWRRSKEILTMLDNGGIIIFVRREPSTSSLTNHDDDDDNEQLEQDVVSQSKILERIKEVKLEFPKLNVQLLSISSLRAVSSSLVRKHIYEDQGYLRKVLEEDVFDYIQERKLYGCEG